MLHQVTYPLLHTLNVSVLLLEVAGLADEVDVEPSAVRLRRCSRILHSHNSAFCAGANLTFRPGRFPPSSVPPWCAICLGVLLALLSHAADVSAPVVSVRVVWGHRPDCFDGVARILPATAVACN